MDKQRIQADMMRLAEIGRSPLGGISRVFGSDFMKQEQQEALRYLEEAGFETFMDPAGNVHGIYRPADACGPEILTGSHLDTVAQGGIFDGLMGFVASVEAVRLLREEGVRLKSPIHVVGTNGEEGNALGGTFGSRAMMGMLNLEDPEYLSLCEKFGYTKQDLEQAKMPVDNIRCYLEMHIEQGKTLYEQKEKIGIVNGIVGLQRYRVNIRGESNHAGTTMMEYRRDALVAAAKLLVRADQLAREMGGGMVATVGKVDAEPGAVAVIPGRAEFILECRNLEETQMERFTANMQKYANTLESVEIEFEPMVKKKPVHCEASLVEELEKICSQMEIPHRIMSSGATHDGNAFAMKLPIGMIFVPSRGGISHNPAEWTEWEDVYTGIEVLARMMCRIGQT